MKDVLFFEARIGSWRKTICFEKIGLPPENLFLALSFCLQRIEYSVSPHILITKKQTAQSRSIFRIKKGDRTLDWIHFKRQITRNSFQILIEKNFQEAQVSTPVVWEDLADLIESWVGYLFEVEQGVRLHGVAFEKMLLLAPSGFGKSYLAVKYWHKLIADEIIYVYDNQIQNLHSSIRLKEPGPWKTRHGERKLLAKQTYPAPIPDIFLGGIGLASIFLGLGLAQHAEFSLSLGSLGGWFEIAVRRMKFIIKNKFWKKQKVNRESANKFLNEG